MAARKKPAAKKKPAPKRPGREAGPFDGVRHAKRRAFLQAFAISGRITVAAAAAKIDRTLHYVWMKDAEYADAFKLAEELAGDLLEDEAVRRAHDGIEEPIVHHGRIMGLWVLPDGRQVPGHTGEGPPEEGADFRPLTINKRSDSLLRTLLEGFKGAKYATQRHHVSGAGGGPVPMAGHGVLLVPATAESVDEWVAAQKQQQKEPPT